MEAFLAEEYGIKDGIVPQEVSASVVNGERISLENLHRVTVLVSVAATASAALSLTLRQHNAASAGDSKDLSVDNMYYHKVDAASSFTKVEPASAAASYDLFAVADVDKAVFAFEVLAEDLDVNNDFSHFSVDVTGDATARLVHAIYVGPADKLPAYELEL